MQHSRLLLPSALALLASLPGYSQSVLSVRSGVVNYFEGSAFLDGQPLAEKFGTFPAIKEGSTLRTENGRAEVLLTPGVFLRIDQNTALRMISTSLSDTQAELLNGSAILDSLQATSDKSVTVIFKDGQVRFPAKGVYRLDSEPASVLRVYKGEAEVMQDGKKSTVDTSHLYFFAAAAATNKFGEDTDDEFSRWAEDRSGAVTAENQLSAETAHDPSDPADLGSGGISPTDPGSGGVSPTDPGLIFGPPSYGNVPGVFAPGNAFVNPYLSAGPSIWGLFPVYPLYLPRHYRNPAYPRQPNHEHWANHTNGAAWSRPVNGDRWRNSWTNRPGYPHSFIPGYQHSFIPGAGISRPSIRPPSFAQRSFPARVGTVGAFPRSVAAPASRPGVAPMAHGGGAHR